jgi:hypothetical protein
MTASSRPWLVAALAVVLLVPVSARAEPPAAPPTEQQVEAARALYREARELRRQGRTREALEKALEAYHTAPTPVTALEAGDLLVTSGRLVEARDLLRGVPLLPVSPRESDKGRDARQQAVSLAGQLDMRIPKIAFAERPPGVELILDGKPVASTDPTAWQGVDPGGHALLVRVDERPCTTVNLSLSEGEERTIDLHDAASACRPAPPPPPPPPPPAAPVPTPPRVVTPPLETTTPEPAPWRWVGAAAVGAGAVAIGVGGYLALSAKSDYDSVAGECPARGCSQNGFDVRNGARSRADAATVVMSVGGVVLVGGGLLWWLAPSSRAGVQGFVGPGSVGVSGAF